MKQKIVDYAEQVRVLVLEMIGKEVYAGW